MEAILLLPRIRKNLPYYIEWALSRGELPLQLEKTPDTLDEHKAQFLFDAKCFVGMGKIPDSLVINWDQTGIQYIPVSS